ncbi:TBC1 domain family member 20-like isoform X1 [Salvelinus namaycush]|uniref:TBC1 domain family member 20 n=2 Tax=Salvelinus TaxID=8033 RepID=A0A8U0TP56_SALNM|nr:TBC1 domain family member 20-like isoform X1 [Salvelinus namaycush]
MKKGRKHQQGTGARVNGNGNAQQHGEHESWKKLKLVVIHQALNCDPVDIETLRSAAVSEGGLLTDEIRRKVWPKLLSVNVYNLPAKPTKDIRENHKDFNQVLLDVRRSMKRFPRGMRVDERQVLQEQLIDIILVVLQKNPALHYYQGYHDIVVTFLLVVGERMAIAMVETLSNHHLRDFMDPTMDSTKHILNYLMPILEQVDPQLHEFMLRAEVGTIFALSWLITWYGHVLSEFRHVLRLYDFFLASHPLMAIYFAAVIVLHREKEVKQTECDMAMVHQLLSKIPQDLPYEELITQAHCLFTRYPPSLLAKRAALQSRKSITINCFKAFQTATQQQRPDSVLRRQLLQGRARGLGGPDSQLVLSGDMQPNQAANQAANQLVKMAVWGISATLGAAALAVAQTALDWAPDFFMQLF